MKNFIIKRKKAGSNKFVKYDFARTPNKALYLTNIYSELSGQLGHEYRIYKEIYVIQVKSIFGKNFTTIGTEFDNKDEAEKYCKKWFMEVYEGRELRIIRKEKYLFEYELNDEIQKEKAKK